MAILSRACFGVILSPVLFDTFERVLATLPKSDTRSQADTGGIDLAEQSTALISFEVLGRIRQTEMMRHLSGCDSWKHHPVASQKLIHASKLFRTC
jgi:hypothetical protein